MTQYSNMYLTMCRYRDRTRVRTSAASEVYMRQRPEQSDKKPGASTSRYAQQHLVLQGMTVCLRKNHSKQTEQVTKYPKSTALRLTHLRKCFRASLESLAVNSTTNAASASEQSKSESQNPKASRACFRGAGLTAW